MLDRPDDRSETQDPVNAPVTAPDRTDQTRRLRRWTWVLVAVAFALMFGVGAALNVAPYVVSGVVENLLWAGVVFGIVMYFVVRGEPAYRRTRASWFGAWVIVLGVVPAMFIAQRVEYKRETEKAGAIVKSMAERLKTADQEYAERLKAGFKESTRAIFATEAIADAAARKEARANVAAVIGIIDDGLARRARILEETIVQIQATGAPKQVKEAIAADIRAASGGREPLSVQIMKGTRAFLGKAEELIAHVDRNAGSVEAREGRLEFTEVSAGERYHALQSELAALGADLQRLGQEKPR